MGGFGEERAEESRILPEDRLEGRSVFSLNVDPSDKAQMLGERVKCAQYAKESFTGIPLYESSFNFWSFFTTIT